MKIGIRSGRNGFLRFRHVWRNLKLFAFICIPAWGGRHRRIFYRICPGRFCQPAVDRKMVDRYNYDVTIVPGLLSIAGAMLIISYAHSLSEFLIAAVIYGFGFGTCQMSLQTMVLKNVRRERLGAANATFFSGVDVGMGLGALTLGSFAEIWGYSDMFIIASSGILLAFLVYVLYIRRHNINTLPA